MFYFYRQYVHVTIITAIIIDVGNLVREGQLS